MTIQWLLQANNPAFTSPLSTVHVISPRATVLQTISRSAFPATFLKRGSAVVGFPSDPHVKGGLDEFDLPATERRDDADIQDVHLRLQFDDGVLVAGDALDRAAVVRPGHG